MCEFYLNYLDVVIQVNIHIIMSISSRSMYNIYLFLSTNRYKIYSMIFILRKSVYINFKWSIACNTYKCVFFVSVVCVIYYSIKKFVRIGDLFFCMETHNSHEHIGTLLYGYIFLFIQYCN